MADRVLRDDRRIAILEETFEELRRRRNALAWKTFVLGLLLGYIVGMVMYG